MDVEYRTFFPRRRFGVELEVESSSIVTKPYLGERLRLFEASRERRPIKIEGGDQGWAESLRNEYWHVKYDSSCGRTGHKMDGGGWEIASYIGQTASQLTAISETLASLRELDLLGAAVRVNQHCGLHYHAEVLGYSIPQIEVLLTHWLKIEDLIFQACPRRRRKNKHCRSLRNRLLGQLPFVEGIWAVIRPVDLGTHENNDKKFTLNTVGFARSLKDNDSRTTVELRLPEASLATEDLLNWGRLYLYFIDQCEWRGYPSSLEPVLSLEEGLEILGLANKRGERFLLLDHSLFETKIWLLRRWLRYSNCSWLLDSAAQLLEEITNL